MTSGVQAILAARKLNFDELGSFDGAGLEWHHTVSELSRELHSPDGVRFIADVGAMLSSGNAPQNDWVGVLRGEFAGAETLSTSFKNCHGLWVTTQQAKDALRAANVSFPIALFPNADAVAHFNGIAGAVANGAVYRSLPTPTSETAELFRHYDLTIMLCSYKRVQNIPGILEAFCTQSYEGSIEVIIWNNNPEATEQLEAAVAPYRSRLDLTMLHSSRNYYCIVRLAMAHLMRGDHLMICDDDVKPGPRYLDTFVSALDEAGDKAVICAKGNTFQPHRMNSESPESVWEKWDHLDFWDVGAAPREIHFMHGSSCLVPRAAIQQLSAIDLPMREYILVDDYWLSYALSALLGWKLWKIDATGAFEFDHSAEDPEVALWLNPRVQQERTNFYVYHMLHGWPEGCSA